MSLFDIPESLEDKVDMLTNINPAYATTRQSVYDLVQHDIAVLRERIEELGGYSDDV